MADPITVLQVISACTNLVAQCAQVIKGLHDLAGKFRNAELSILSIAYELDTVRLAWERIEGVLKSWEGMMETIEDSDHDLLARLRQNLGFGDLIVTSLAEDMNTFIKRPFTFAQRSRYVWNQEKFRGHQDRIRGQVGAMNLLVSVLNLSSAPERANLLEDGEEILRKSDESAYSIVPSYLSSRIASLYSNPSGLSVDSAELVYRQLTIDDDLFTARVYKRNYRHPFMKLPKRLSPSNISFEGGQLSNIDTAAQLPDQQSGRASPDSQLFVSGDREGWNPSHAQPSPYIHETLLETCKDIEFLSSPWILRAPNDSIIDSDVFVGPAVSIDLVYAYQGRSDCRESVRVLRRSVRESQPRHLQQLLLLLGSGFGDWRRRFCREASDQKRDDLIRLLIENDQSLESWLLTQSCVSLEQPWSFAYEAASAASAVSTKLLQHLYFERPKTDETDAKIHEILLLACMKGHTKIVNCLRWDSSILGGRGSELLLAAAYNVHPETVQLLLESGCDIHADPGSPDPLLVGIVITWAYAGVVVDINRAIQVLNILLHHGANITDRTLWGENFYHSVAFGGLPWSIWALHAIEVGQESHKVAIRARDNNGDTPKDVAEAHTNEVFLAYLDNVEIIEKLNMNQPSFSS